MVRKFAAALVALAIAVGSVFAEEIRGTFVKFADGTLTLKVGDKEKEYKIPSDLKVKRKTKDGEVKEFAAEDMLKSKFMKEGSTKLILTTEGDKVTDVRVDFKGRGKKEEKK
jgi:hypothetical protein